MAIPSEFFTDSHSVNFSFQVCSFQVCSFQILSFRESSFPDWRFIANHRVDFCDYWRPAANRQRPSQASDWCTTASPFKISALGSPAPPGDMSRWLMTSLVVRVNVGPDSGFDQFMPTEVYTLHLFVDMSGSTKRTVHTDQGSTQEWRMLNKRPA